MADLMDFTDSENKENSIVSITDENDIQVAPGLVQSPVIVKSILKQCQKDNLIQLYTPVQKPEKGRLKVHFGHDSLLQTPNVKQVKKVKGDVLPIKEGLETISKADNENIQTQKVEADVVHTTVSSEDVVKDGEKQVVDNASVEVAEEIVSHVIDQLPIKDDIDSNGSADSGIEECAMEVSISEPTTTETFDGSSDIDDILLKSEMLLRSLRGELFSTDSAADDSSQADKTTSEVSDKQNEAGVSNEIQTKDDTVKEDSGTGSEASHGKEATDDSDVVSQRNLADSNEKEGGRQNEIKSEEIKETEKESEIHSYTNEEEPMEVGEAMEVDDDDDDEIVFNFGDKGNAESNVDTEEKTSKLVENTTVTSETKENSISENMSESVDNIDDAKVTKADTDKIDGKIEDKTENMPIQDSSVKEECVVSDKVEKDNNTGAINSDEGECSDKPEKTAMTLKDEETKDVQIPADTENAKQDGKTGKEAKKKGDDSSDEEFMSADEDMEVDEAKTPSKSTLPETQNQQDNNIEPKQDSPERTPPKVGYNLNFDDLDAMDPFSTKKALLNSPDLGKEAVKKKVEKKTDEQEDKSDNKTDVKNTESTENFKSANSSPVKSEPTKAEIILSPNAVLVDKVCQDKSAGDIFEEKPDCLLPDDAKLPNDADILTEENKSSSHSIDIGQELDPKKELDFDNMDPFKPKTQIVNTPDKATLNKNTNIKMENEVPVTNPIINTPVKTEVNDNVVDIKPDTCEATTDKELPSMNIENTEDKQSEEHPVTPHKEKIEDKQPPSASPQIPLTTGAYNLDALDIDEIDPFKPLVQMANSPCGSISETKAATVDSFKPKKQIMNSPVVNKEHGETKSDGIDPFKPKTQIINSPDSNKQVPVLANSDNKDAVTSQPGLEEKNPALEAKSMETLEEITDPFKTVSQVGNSPLKEENKLNICETDPFKSKSQVQNSPVKTASDDTCNNNDNVDIVDPLKPQNQMQNSPVNKTTECNKISDNVETVAESSNAAAGKETEMDSEILDIELMDDPFKPKNQMQNSPILKDKVNVAEKVETEISDTVKDEASTNNTIDPFSNVDPFKSKKQLAMSPPVKSGSQVDPFADLNPFQTKSTVVNTPEKPETESIEKGVKTVTKIDPFKSSGGICNSPALTTIEEMPFVTKSRVANTPTKEDDPFSKKFEIPTAPLNEPDEQVGGIGDIFEVQGVTRRGEEGTQANQFGDIDESQFVSASQVFNDPAAWEMLEKLGGGSSDSGESALSRMSLYVKFDPLVDEAPINPRRISIRVSQLEKVKEYGLDETLLLLGTPPKRRRQSLARNTSSELKSAASFVPQPPVKKAEPVGTTPGGVDLILAYSPEKKDQFEMNVDNQDAPVMKLFEDEDSNVDSQNIFQELKYTEADLKKFQRDNKLAMQGILINKDKELCKKEKQWEKEKAELIKKCQNIKQDRGKLEQAFLALEQTVYEIAALKDAAEKKVEKIAVEKAQAVEDIQAVETAFSDLHRRYEKAKTMVMSMKKNEETLKKATADSLEKQKTLNEKLHAVEKSAEEKLAANKAEIEKLIHQRDSIQNKFDAHIKITNIKIGNLETAIERKTVENKELTEICDNLLSKVDK
ncbi:transforming acidic coiled-coil-containing protein 2-like [Ruditapes philippinarum]|uniref:transforming acidic coiled-coil-containing protein 2-like n=1 Tax=Ruditapes philippinarum TaxID=129788 RepID=UPI00295AB1DE|nr:transforming acidic coiled-coil-containing protein 2-like [Ruditapes philippinarum]